MDKIIKFVDNEFLSVSLEAALSDIVGKKCCRQRVGEYKSLTLGFGEKIPHFRKKAYDTFSGEWEIGTYCSAWRIIEKNKLICGSMDPVDSLEELDVKLSGIEFGRVLNIEMMSEFDIRLVLDNEIVIEFLCATDYDDEVIFIFGPNHLYVQYTLNEGWRFGKSNVPWV